MIPAESERTPVLCAIIDTLSAHHDVAAIALGGSRATSRNDTSSDHDLYVFVDGEIPLTVRRELAKAFDPEPEIGNT